MNADINWEQLALVVGDENEPADEEMIDLYRLFVEDAGQRLGRISNPAAAVDATFVAREAHKIRGAASSFGFDRVADILREVETQINQLGQVVIQQKLHDASAAFQASVRGVAEKFPALAA
ncbi:MAG: Hpt domain-containing protein [Opitutaceae bacterium]